METVSNPLIIDIVFIGNQHGHMDSILKIYPSIRISENYAKHKFDKSRKSCQLL